MGNNISGPLSVLHVAYLDFLISARGTSRSSSDSGAPLAAVCLESDLLCTAGEQLQINQPKVYNCDVPESLAPRVPSLVALCGKTRLASHAFPTIKTLANRSVTLMSGGGTKFISFAKGRSFHDGMTLEK